MPHAINELTLDAAGRVTLPKALRKQLQLEPGDTLRLESHGEQITLQPVRPSAPIRKEQGIWVFRSGQPTSHSIRQLIEEARNVRALRILDPGE
jgi:AbrB family looped-hinge helix DNA binding protein